MLHQLPVCHNLRCMPLGCIDAEVRNVGSKTWRSLASWKIAKASFNQLGPVWTANNEFRVTIRMV